ncbi:MAG: Fe-S-containing protein [bacterium]
MSKSNRKRPTQPKRPARPAQQGTKRERFEEAGKFPVKKVVIAGVAVVVVVVAVVVGVQTYNNSTEVGGAVVSQGGVNYADASVEMSPLASSQKTEAGTVTLSLAEVTAKKIGGFVYSRSKAMPVGFDSVEGNGLPMLAYVAPSGRLVVATSLCEPCRSWNFHIEGGALVCNSCFTNWDLNTLKGISGGCLDFPPEEVNAIVQGDVIEIQQSELEAWTPRI